MEKVNPFTFPGTENIITPSKVMAAVAHIYNIEIEQMLEDNQRQKVVEPRQICMYLMYNHIKLSFAAVGQIMTTQNGRSFDHTSVMHSINRVKQYRETNKTYNERCTFIEKFLKGEVDLDNYIEADKRKKEVENLMVAITKGRKMIDELLDDPEERYVDIIDTMKTEMMDLGYHIAKRIAAIHQKLWMRYDSDKMNRY